MAVLLRVGTLAAAFCLSVAPVSRADKLVVVAGGGRGGDGIPATRARLEAPFGLGFDRAGNMYIVDMDAARIDKVDPKGLFTGLAGLGLKGPHSLAVAPDGPVYVADTWNHRVRKLDPKTGRMSAFAGTGVKGFGGDGGPALKAKFGGVYCVALSPDGKRLYVADLDNRRIRAIDLHTGIVSTVAGNGKRGVPQDGADALQAPLVDPRAVAVDSQGNVYILERSGNALRVVSAAGKIRTVAGTGKAGLSGDGGPALKATLRSPKHLCIDRHDNVVIADSANHAIRTYLAREGKIVRTAGTGKKGAAGAGGPPLEIELDEPHGVWVDRAGTLYIADSNNHRILKLVK